MKTIILDRMDKEIKDLQSKRDLIESLKIEKVDEKTWHEICLTPARHSDLLLEIAEKTFPQGENFERGTNEITFTLNGFDIELPTSAINGIKIVNIRDWYYPNIPEPVKSTRYEDMERYFKLLDSGKYTWYDLAYCRNTNRKNISKFKLFVWWFCKAKWRNIDRSAWEEQFESDEKSYQLACERYQKRIKHMEEKLSTINDTIDILKQFAEVRGYVKCKETDTWLTMNIEKYFE